MDEGGVLFCSRTEVYFGVNEVGGRIWALLPDTDEAGTFEDLRRSLSATYPDAGEEELAADIREFLTALEESELVADAPGGVRSS